MNKILKIILWIVISLNFFPVVFAAAGWDGWGGWDGWSSTTLHWRFETELLEAVEPLSWHLDAAQPNDPNWWGNTVANFVFKFLQNIVIPLAISVWVVMWIVWAYKLLFSSDEKEVSSWLKMIAFWVIWIIIMISARYIWKVLFEDIFYSWEVSWMNWIQFSKDIYDKLVYPFIKIVLYLALAVIFILLVWKSISLLTTTDWTSHKKALWMIWWCALAILIIIGAKNIVEAIYWKQETVFRSVSNLWDIWSGVLSDTHIPILYNVMTRVLSIIWLVIFLLLLVQWFKILLNPGKAENFQKLWKSILYALIWLFVIWIGYLLANTFILN